MNKQEDVHLEGNNLLPSLVKKSVDLGKSWLLNSGIQNLEKNSPFCGGVNSWYDADKKHYGFIYPEVTGYAMTFFLYLNRYENNDGLVDRAVKAGHWIRETAFDRKTVEIRHQFFHDPTIPPSNYSYSFDNGIILGGYIHLFRETGNSVYLHIARRIADRLIENMQSPEGYFSSHYDLENEKIAAKEDQWSQQPSSHHVKISIAMLNLYEDTGDERYKNSAVRICDWALQRQRETGQFITNSLSNSTLLHPHCYALEGLLFSGQHLHNETYISSAIKGVRWILQAQLENGGIPEKFRNGSFNSSERGDSLAQTVRLAVLALQHDLIGDEFMPALQRMITRLLAFQSTENSRPERGGFRFFCDGKGRWMNHYNSWTSMFAVHALNAFLNLVEKKKGFEMNYFV